LLKPEKLLVVRGQKRWIFLPGIGSSGKVGLFLVAATRSDISWALAKTLRDMPTFTATLYWEPLL